MAFPLAALAKLIFGGGGQAASGAAAAAPTFVGAAGGAAGGGATAGLTKVAEGSMMSKLLSMGKSALQNPQVQQILSATGANLAGPGSLAESWNDITQQRIATQSYAKVLSKLLRGEIEGGKFEISDKGTKMQFPNQKGGTSELGSVGDTSGLGVEGTPNAGMFRAANPFSPSQSGISAADLTGLTPQDISSAFQDTLGVEALKQKRVSDIVDMIYKRAQIEKMGREPLEDIYPVPGPGGVYLTLRQWRALPPDEKSYYIAKQQAAELGDKEFMSKEEWEMLQPTEREKFISAALKKPEIMRGAKELARSGATRITLGERREIEEMKDVVTRKSEVLDPRYARTLEKELQSSMGKATWANLPNIKKYIALGLSRPEASRKAQQVTVLEAWDKEVRKYVPNAEFKPDKDPVGWYDEDKLILESPYK